MKREQKEAILKYVNRVDPEGNVVKIQPTPDLESGTVTFGREITQRRVETQLKPEKWVEASLVAKLVCELHYPASAIELQREYPAGHPETSRPRVDIVVEDNRGEESKTFMIIEAKAPEEYENQKAGIEGQLFALGDHERPKGLRYMIYYTVDYIDNQLEDKAIIIDAMRFVDYQSWQNAGCPSLDQLPIGYTVAIKSIYVNKDNKDLKLGEKNLNKRLTRNEFLALRRNLHNVLWGGGGTPDNDVFSNLVKLFLAKIYDEEFTPESQPYAFQIFYKDGEPEPASEIVARLNSKRKLSDGQYEGIFRRAQKEYLEMSDEEIVASQGLDVEKISPGKIAYVVEQLQGISLTENENLDGSDVLGEFFEGIVREGFKQSKGQFFTHPNIVRFCIYALKLDELVEEKLRRENTLPYIIDPACGSGTFLIEAMKIVTRTVKTRNLGNTLHRRAQQLIASWFPPLKENVWARDFIYGIEINPDLALATKVNMVLHGDGNINVLIRDGLLDFSAYRMDKKVSVLAEKSVKPGFPYQFQVNEQFDVLLSNPPFSVDLDNETKRGLQARFEFAHKRNSENLFIERWYQLLKPGGRMAVVLPEAVFDTKENEYIRLFLFRYFHIKAIVSLPELAFKPWTPTRTSLLFAVKKKDDEVREYDKLWHKKTKEFKKLLESKPVTYVLTGEKLLQATNQLCSTYNIQISEEGPPVMKVRSLKGMLESLKTRLDLNPRHLSRVERYLAILEEWTNVDPDSEWPLDETETCLRSVLKSFFVSRFAGRSLLELINIYWEEIVQIANSSWWIFTEVVRNLDEKILYFEVNNIGYKRITNRERETVNELFSIRDGEIYLEDQETILGQIRAQVVY